MAAVRLIVLSQDAQTGTLLECSCMYGTSPSMPKKRKRETAKTYMLAGMRCLGSAVLCTP